MRLSVIILIINGIRTLLIHLFYAIFYNDSNYKIVYLNCQTIMSTLFNSQQNININISYNLAHDRSKNIAAKKMHKSTKVKRKTPQPQIILKKPILEKNNEKDICLQSQKAPKLKKKMVRQLNSPQLLPQRRFKTQTHQTEYSANNKKDYFSMKTAEKNSHNHNKSIQIPITKNQRSTVLKKKNNTKSKTKKSHNHINSCQFAFLKKPFMNIQHITSAQLPAQVERKRRTQSATIIHPKQDKIVTKLINMSLLGSEIGGSQVLSNQMREQNTYQRLLKQVMSSLDMNILKHMHQDKGNEILNEQIKKPSIVSYLTKVRKIPLEDLNRAASVIQNAWRSKMKKQVITYYGNLLQKAISKKTLKQKQDLSLLQNPVFEQQFDIDHNQFFQSESSNSNNFNQNNSYGQANQDTFNFTQQDIHKSRYDIQQSPKEMQQKSLNILKYQKLVQEKKKSNQKKQQKAGWNKVSQLLSNNMKTGCKIDNSKILDELIKQSKFMEGWMDQNNSQSQNFRDSSNTSQNPSTIIKEAQKVNQDIQQQTKFQPEIIDDDESEHEQQDYNFHKYANQIGPEQQQWDNRWIRQQLTKSDMNNYLNCGLGDFGLSVNSSNNQFQGNQDGNEQEINEDQPISEIHLQNEKILQRQREQHQQLNLPSAQVSFKQSLSMSQDEQNKGKETVDQIIQQLMTQLALDIATILQRSSKRAFTNQPFKKKKGIPTNFSAIRDYLTKLKNFIMTNPNYIEKVTNNLNKELGPSSLEVLSYLRINPDDDIEQFYDELQDMDQDQDHLYAIPIYLFQQFENLLYKSEVNKQNQQSIEKMKPFSNFFHRAIFQAFNQCLDYEKPYGLAGKPYDWTIQPRLPKTLTSKNLNNIMNNAIGRLLQLTSFVGGVIFQKDDSPFGGGAIEEEYKQQVNQERLSRMLANQLFDTEQTWITYNDQIAEALVQVSRLVADRIFDECCAELKKITRKRKFMLEVLEDIEQYHQ